MGEGSCFENSRAEALWVRFPPYPPKIAGYASGQSKRSHKPCRKVRGFKSHLRTQNARLAEWTMAAGCNPAGFIPRGFESLSEHHFRCSVTLHSSCFVIRYSRCKLVCYRLERETFEQLPERGRESQINELVRRKTKGQKSALSVKVLQGLTHARPSLDNHHFSLKRESK
jgi:hypothetical protein